MLDYESRDFNCASQMGERKVCQCSRVAPAQGLPLASVTRDMAWGVSPVIEGYLEVLEDAPLLQERLTARVCLLSHL
jgi:hypothetical protein